MQRHLNQVWPVSQVSSLRSLSGHYTPSCQLITSLSPPPLELRSFSLIMSDIKDAQKRAMLWRHSVWNTGIYNPGSSGIQSSPSELFKSRSLRIEDSFLHMFAFGPAELAAHSLLWQLIRCWLVVRGIVIACAADVISSGMFSPWMCVFTFLILLTSAVWKIIRASGCMSCVFFCCCFCQRG